ncbi:MAG: phosphoribosyltransferase family protein [Acinetobacter sp.]
MFNFLRLLLPCRLCNIDKAIAKHGLCQDCWDNLPWFHQNIIRQNTTIQVACTYQYPLNRVIQQFKYEQQLHYTTLLSEILLQLKLPRVQAIVPMPISSQRLAERGFNQAMLLARPLSKHLQVPLWSPIIRHNEQHQKGLTRHERLANIQQQFSQHAQLQIRYRRVLIVDDVVTTGSSIRALSQTLHGIGCSKVYAVCLASA